MTYVNTLFTNQGIVYSIHFRYANNGKINGKSLQNEHKNESIDEIERKYCIYLVFMKMNLFYCYIFAFVVILFDRYMTS